MNINQLELLVALIETGSFSEAGDQMGLTQSAVSHGLAKLETELGVVLVARNRRGLSLTGAGQEVSIHVRAALAALEAIRQSAATARGVPVGRMRFGTAYPVSALLLAGILSDFQRQYPAIDLILFEGTGQEVEEWIRGSVVDVGIVRHPTPNMESRLLVEDEICVVFPENHRLRHSVRVDVAELLSEPLILPRSGHALVGEALREIGQDDAEVSFKYTVSDLRTIFLMVQDGLGVTLMPRTTLPDDLDGLLTLPLSPIMPFRVGLGMRSWDAATPVARLFAQTAETWAMTHGFLG